jgi:hypothetical protein
VGVTLGRACGDWIGDWDVVIAKIVLTYIMFRC